MAVPQDGHFGFAAVRGIGDVHRQIARPLDRLAIERGDHIALLQLRFVGRGIGLDLVDEDAMGFGLADRGCKRRGQRLHRDAQPAALDLAVVTKLRHDLGGEVGRDGEADADAAAVRRADRQVSGPDHLTRLAVEQWAAPNCRD